MDKKQKNDYNKLWRALNPDYSKNYMKKYRAEGRDFYSKKKDAERMKKYKGTPSRIDTINRASKKYRNKLKDLVSDINYNVGFPNFILWKLIPNTKHRYAVSDTGQIYDLFYQTLCLTYRDRKGVYIDLKVNKKMVRYRLHQLVGEAFLNKRKMRKKGWIEHIDGDKYNNCITNLIWVSPIEKLLNSQFYKDLQSVGFSYYHYVRKFIKKV